MTRVILLFLTALAACGAESPPKPPAAVSSISVTGNASAGVVNKG